MNEHRLFPIQRSGDSVMKKSIVSVVLAFVFACMIGLPANLRGADAPATAPSTAPSAEGVQRFYGAVTAIDKEKQTFTVDNQVYMVVPESQMTKAADDSHATLADATVGEPARGTYTKAGDGS